MQSFRTELEDPIVNRDIIELEKSIYAFQNGQLHEEKFRSLRLARGVYGQRQPGVQMVRIKIPLGRFSARQLRRIADLSDEYATGNLHLTTRQDVQLHFVQLERTPQLWAELEKEEITLREACGNTVRNVTASIFAGIDPDEPFDVSPYAEAFFRYFLRNPICQDLGRKVKVAFSSSEKDSAGVFFHDLGFIPVLLDGAPGFKVVLGGGIGSQPKGADLVSSFLPVSQLIPFSEAVLRVFDRYGERNRRNKARLKFLIKEIGLDIFLHYVETEKKALPYQEYPIEPSPTTFKKTRAALRSPEFPDATYQTWLHTNVFPQKQSGYVAVGIPVRTGDLSSTSARRLADIIETYTGDDSRFSSTQSILLRFVHQENIPRLYAELADAGLARPGFHRINDIVACPGTDTCNLGIGSSMGLAHVLQDILEKEFASLLEKHDISIKISGCMNACGQHTVANIGFQGMTLNQDNRIAPATQVLLGGGTLTQGNGRFADKVLKVPSRRVPDVLRWILCDFEANHLPHEAFNTYYDRCGEAYFFQHLKVYSDTENLSESDYVDWGNEVFYEKAIGIGECAGVQIDLVQTLFFEAEEMLDLAHLAFSDERWSDAIYHTYAAFIRSGKALLVAQEAKVNTHESIISGFDPHFPELAQSLGRPYKAIISQINQHTPTRRFAESYVHDAHTVLGWVKHYRHGQTH